MSGSKDIVSILKDIVSSSKDIVSDSKDIVSGSKEMMSGTKDIVSGTKEMMSGTKDIKTRSNDIKTDTKFIICINDKATTSLRKKAVWRRKEAVLDEILNNKWRNGRDTGIKNTKNVVKGSILI